MNLPTNTTADGTAFASGGHADADGLANTTPYVMEVYEI